MTINAVPPTAPEIIKTPPVNPNVNRNPGDDLKLPSDKPMGEVRGGEASPSPDDDEEPEDTDAADDDSAGKSEDEADDESQPAQ